MEEFTTDFKPQTIPIPCPPKLQPGDRVRVTHLADMLNYDGGPIDYPAGDVIDGVVEHVDSSGFFSLVAEYGETRGYHSLDSTLRIQLLTPNG